MELTFKCLTTQTIPQPILKTHQLSAIVLEYRKECGSSDIVQSLCEPEEEGIEGIGQDSNDISLFKGFSLTSDMLEGRGLIKKRPLRYTHLLQTKGKHKNEEIVRGRTTWKKKLSY